MKRGSQCGAKAAPTSPAMSPASTATPGRLSNARAMTLGRKWLPIVMP
jgi:hypothetical protein